MENYYCGRFHIYEWMMYVCMRINDVAFYTLLKHLTPSHFA